MILIEALGGLLLFAASFLVIRAVMAADSVGPSPTVRRRRGKALNLRRAA